MSRNWTIVFLSFSFSALLACTSAPHYDGELKLRNFISVASAHPDRLWAQSLTDRAKSAIADFNQKKRLTTGKIYGDSVRKYDLHNKCVSDIDLDMSHLGCKRNMDVLKNPQSNKPLLTQKGQTIPLIVYLCDDGGVVRLKPEGDLTSKFKPQPIASKALRYPFDSKFENFDDEILKVDNFGNAIPKWTKDLNPQLGNAEEQPDLVQGWADDAHTDLKLDCPNPPFRR